MTPINLAAMIMQQALLRAHVESTQIEDVIWGCVTPLGDQGANLARLAVLKAGFPVEVPGVTLNRMCGSSQKAVHFASQAILNGDMQIVLAGGTEMMSHQPIGSDWPEQWSDDFPYALVHQGISAGAVALILASAKAVGRYNLIPKARLVARAVVGSDPVLMLDGPIPATRQVLKCAGLSL
jgi:acetyl-CoA acetyltransferase